MIFLAQGTSFICQATVCFFVQTSTILSTLSVFKIILMPCARSIFCNENMVPLSPQLISNIKALKRKHHSEDPKAFFESRVINQDFQLAADT